MIVSMPLLNTVLMCFRRAIEGTSDDLVDNAVIANVRYQIGKLKLNSSILSQKLLDNKLKIIGGRYDLDTGEVSLI